MDSYTRRQIEAANLLKGTSPELIDEIVAMIGEVEQNKTDPVSPKKEDTEMSIKLKILEETDWRKKAALSAMLISKSLE
jgi:hypothetical protein